MQKFKAILIITIIALALIGCGAEENVPEPEPEVTSGPVPSIEILAGYPDTCLMADTEQSTVMGFDVIYSHIGTDVYMVGAMTAPYIGEIGSVGTPGEGRDGEASWGIYPEQYDLAPNTHITLIITVHAGPDENATITSTSSLTYNCTTGETSGTSFKTP